MARTKQQIQLMVMAGIVACFVLYVFIQFLVVPIAADVKETRLETEKTEKQLEEIWRTVRGRAALQERARQVQASVRESAELLPLPVLGNYLIGMDEAIRSCAEGLDMEIVGIVSAGEPATIEGGSGIFKVFQTRCVVRSGFHDLARFFYNIEKRYPFVSVSGVTINPQDDNPRRHAVNVVVSWLIWSDPLNLPEFIHAGKGGEGF